MPVKALLFDKDGTLFDFEETWNSWTLGVINHYARGDTKRGQHIAKTIEFDLDACAFLPTSPIIAGTNREAAELVASAVPGSDVDEVELYLAESAAKAPLAPVVPLRPLMQSFAEQGLRLGVVTNDTERSARRHLTSAKVLESFDFVAGHDSGIGAKPDPDPLLAFAARFDIAPQDVVMVGDSTHDLLAGRRAGMKTVGVLTGLAEEATLAPLADVVLPHIGFLPDWLKNT